MTVAFTVLLLVSDDARPPLVPARGSNLGSQGSEPPASRFREMQSQEELNAPLLRSVPSLASELPRYPLGPILGNPPRGGAVW